MALNGIAPLLVFRFTNNAAVNVVKNIPVIGNFLAENVGVPIPIYLDENLTGIYVHGESKAIDIETTVEARNDKKAPIVDQRALNSVTTINFVANNRGVMLMTLLAFADVIMSRVVSKQYTVSYFNGPTIIIDGLLHGFTTQPGENDTKINIQMTISKANQLSTGAQVEGSVPELEKHTGALPI